MLTFNGVTSERADEILSSLDKNVLEKLAEVLGNIGASTFFIEEVFNKHNYLNTVAYFVIPMVGVGTGKVVLVYVDEADVVGLNTTFEELEKFLGLPVALCSCNDTMEYLCTSTLKEKYRIEEF